MEFFGDFRRFPEVPGDHSNEGQNLLVWEFVTDLLETRKAELCSVNEMGVQ